MIKTHADCVAGKMRMDRKVAGAAPVTSPRLSNTGTCQYITKLRGQPRVRVTLLRRDCVIACPILAIIVTFTWNRLA